MKRDLRSDDVTANDIERATLLARSLSGLMPVFSGRRPTLYLIVTVSGPRSNLGRCGGIDIEQCAVGDDLFFVNRSDEMYSVRFKREEDANWVEGGKIPPGQEAPYKLWEPGKRETKRHRQGKWLCEARPDGGTLQETDFNVAW